MYIYARYTRPASELNCLRFNLLELLILWQRTSCGNLQGNLFYDNPIQSMHSRWFQNLVIHLSITIWKFLNSETFYYAVDPVNPTLTKRFTPDFESRFISFFTQLGSLFITLRQLSSLGLSLTFCCNFPRTLTTVYCLDTPPLGTSWSNHLEMRVLDEISQNRKVDKLRDLLLKH